MTITKTELVGNGCTAVISRAVGHTKIRIVILSPQGEQSFAVKVNDVPNMMDLAQRLQETLDGYKGTNSEVHEYFRELQRLAEQ